MYELRSYFSFAFLVVVPSLELAGQILSAYLSEQLPLVPGNRVDLADQKLRERTAARAYVLSCLLDDVLLRDVPVREAEAPHLLEDVQEEHSALRIVEDVFSRTK